MIDLTSYRMVAFLGGCALTVGFVILAFAGNIGIVYLAFFSSGKWKNKRLWWIIFKC